MRRERDDERDETNRHAQQSELCPLRARQFCHLIHEIQHKLCRVYRFIRSHHLHERREARGVFGTKRTRLAVAVRLNVRPNLLRVRVHRAHVSGEHIASPTRAFPLVREIEYFFVHLS